MKLILLSFLVSASLLAQTRVNAPQLIVPETVSYEERWCPGPALEVDFSRLSVLVGKNWANGRPCYIHFNLVPPTKVDPMSVSSFVEPFYVRIKAGFVGDEDVYLYAVAPTFTPAANAKIAARVKSLASIECGGCTGGIQQDARMPRMFPPSTVPIGFLAIRGGKFLPKPDELLSRQQVFIGPGAEMSVIPDQGGYWFQVSPAAAAQAQVTAAANALKAQQALLVARTTAMTPPPAQELQAVKQQVQSLQSEVSRINEIVPPDAEVMRIRIRDFEMATDSAQERLSNAMEGVRQEADQRIGQLLFSASERVPVPSSPGETCAVHSWAQDEKFLYRCLPALQAAAPSSWVRMPYDRKWGK